MLIVDAVLTGSMEVELSKLVGASLGDQGTVGQDNLKTGAKVLKLDIVGTWDVEVDGVGGSIINVFGDDVDGRLTLASGASTVLRTESVPVKGAAEVGVVVGIDVDGAISRTGQQ